MTVADAVSGWALNLAADVMDFIGNLLVIRKLILEVSVKPGRLSGYVYIYADATVFGFDFKDELRIDLDNIIKSAAAAFVGVKKDSHNNVVRKAVKFDTSSPSIGVYDPASAAPVEAASGAAPVEVWKRIRTWDYGEITRSFCAHIDREHYWGRYYRGEVAVTETGLTCQDWSSQMPHSHSVNLFYYPESGIGFHNRCRNPDASPSLWCFTTDPAVRRAPCRVPDCTDLEVRFHAGSERVGLTANLKVDHLWLGLGARAAQTYAGKLLTLGEQRGGLGGKLRITEPRPWTRMNAFSITYELATEVCELDMGAATPAGNEVVWTCYTTAAWAAKTDPLIYQVSWAGDACIKKHGNNLEAGCPFGENNYVISFQMALGTSTVTKYLSAGDATATPRAPVWVESQPQDAKQIGIFMAGSPVHVYRGH